MSFFHPYSVSLISLICIFNYNNSLAQDSIFKSIDNQFILSAERMDKLFDYYEIDFIEWKDKVDLTKINLKPEKAKINRYSTSLSDREKVLKESYKYIGIPYIWGGNNPKGFDCSGLVQWILKKTHDILIERTTRLQSNKWRSELKFDLSLIKPGDLIYFKTKKNQISHVGVYSGDNKFIHAPNRKTNVKESKLSDYWLKKFAGYLDLEVLIKK
jgi:cell wall-associated NlpC family hydrolase|tara:strand:- start:618 stop:1259 length:642 start_codon:yes stop_codon:yes gene_type:complete